MEYFILFYLPLSVLFFFIFMIARIPVSGYRGLSAYLIILIAHLILNVIYRNWSKGFWIHFDLTVFLNFLYGPVLFMIASENLNFKSFLFREKKFILIVSSVFIVNLFMGTHWIFTHSMIHIPYFNLSFALRFFIALSSWYFVNKTWNHPKLQHTLPMARLVRLLSVCLLVQVSLLFLFNLAFLSGILNMSENYHMVEVVRMLLLIFSITCILKYYYVKHQLLVSRYFHFNNLNNQHSILFSDYAEINEKTDTLAELKQDVLKHERSIPARNNSSKDSLPVNKYVSIISELNHLLVERALYREVDLSLDRLSAVSFIPRHLISDALNNHLHKTFYEYLNEFRIQYVKTLIMEAVRNGDKINLMILSYKAGFRSKSTFNMYFKKITGSTPSNFIEKISVDEMDLIA